MKLSPTLRKAAILISSLDARSADALLEQMGEAQAQRVRDAVMNLDDIDPAEQERIINEFLGGQRPARSATYDDSIELSGSLAQTIGTARVTVPAPSAPQACTTPFGFLHDAASDLVARHLLREHPQTIAVVLAHLPPARAAGIVKQFPVDVRTDVLMRIGDIDEMNADVVREVERGLEAVLSRELQSARRRGAGAATLQAILAAAGEIDGLLPAGVERPSPPPASRVGATSIPRRRFELPVTPLAANPSRPAARTDEDARPATIEFAQMGQLDDRAWAKILRAADAQMSLLALAGATPELVQRLLKQLQPRDARILERKMETLGPVRLRDIEHAQQQLARIACQLAAQGEIRLPRQRPFATAA